jgi:hypothetical protein
MWWGKGQSGDRQAGQKPAQPANQLAQVVYSTRPAKSIQQNTAISTVSRFHREYTSGAKPAEWHRPWPTLPPAQPDPPQAPFRPGKRRGAGAISPALVAPASAAPPIGSENRVSQAELDRIVARHQLTLDRNSFSAPANISRRGLSRLSLLSEFRPGILYDVYALLASLWEFRQGGPALNSRHAYTRNHLITYCSTL